MRCPYCGGLNQDKALFCMSCGRDLRRTPPNTQASRPPAQATQRPAYPQPAPSARPASTPAQPSAQAARSASGRRQTVGASTGAGPAAAPLVPPAPQPEPESPVPFPPRTIAQFEALLPAGCQTYNLAESHIENGQRKVITIIYTRCAGWQQAATLLKALQENQEERYPTIIVRGLLAQQPDAYGFNNGQLQFDRKALLGSKVGRRYVLETGNGYAIDSQRFVLNE